MARDVYLQRPPDLKTGMNKLHNKLYEYLEQKLDKIWSKFPYGCENICLLSEEIVDNTFLHDSNTRVLRIRLDCEDSGAIEMKLWHDGVPHNDQTAAKRAPVVVGILSRLNAEYVAFQDHEIEDAVLTDSAPRQCRTIKL